MTDLAKKMRENQKSPSLEFDVTDQILAGIELRMQYLGSGELSKCGGTDQEIAHVIHDIHNLYAQRKNSLKKALEVLVFIDTQRINVYTKEEDEVLMNFPLTQVKDVTACLDQPPYSKTCVLVAKEDNQSTYKAHVFYCKTSQKAAEFYQVASLTFQVGFKLLEKFSPLTENANDDVFVNWNDSTDGNVKEDVLESDSNETKSGLYKRHGNNIAENHEPTSEHKKPNSPSNTRKEDSRKERTVTIGLQNKNGSVKNEVALPKIDLGLNERSNNLNQSKLGIYLDNAEERSRFLLSRWFRSSYQKFRRFSGQDSTTEVDEYQL